jgi:hypothetical protein
MTVKEQKRPWYGQHTVNSPRNHQPVSPHDPEHDDEFLDRIEKLCRERFPNTVLAREGMEIPI